MQHFIISPSEAFLLGCCVGEYREARRDNEYADFPYFLITRLQPFVPDVVAVTSPIPRDEVPYGLSWYGDDSNEIAFDDEVVYRRCIDGVTKTEWDRSVKSLVDLVAELISPHATWSLFAKWSLPLPGMELTGQFGHHLMQICGTSEDVDEMALRSAWYTPEKPDDETGLCDAIEALVQDKLNDLRKTYADGQVYGRLLAAVERVKISYLSGVYLHEQHPWHFDYRHGKLLWKCVDSGDDWWHDYRLAVNKVARCDISAKLFHALTICATESQRSGACSPDITLEYASSIARAECAVRTTVGIVLGSLRDVDNEAHSRNAQSAVPRAFILGPDATSDRITGQIQIIGQLLDDRIGVAAQPEQIISFAENLIEGLAKSLWPEKFAKHGRERALRNILLEYRRTGTELERHFSDIALPLYDHYRGPAQHQMRDFRCSWTEARYFYLGIQTLSEIQKKIVKERARPPFASS